MPKRFGRMSSLDIKIDIRMAQERREYRAKELAYEQDKAKFFRGEITKETLLKTYSEDFVNGQGLYFR